jgi:hypothetical protein
MSMVRVVVAIVACVVFVAVASLLGSGSRSLATRELLLRESAALLPPDARVLTHEYRERCHDFLALDSPPCVSVRFLAPGDANRLAGATLDRASDRWHLARKQRHRDGWDLRFFRSGQLRAHTSIRTPESYDRCRSSFLVPASNADSLVVELGPPTVFPKFEIPPPSVIAELLDRLRENPPLVLTTPAETYSDWGGAAGTQLHPEARPC